MYKIIKITEREMFKNIKDAWNMCCLNDSECSPFQFFEWQYHYYHIFGDNKDLAIYIISDVENSNLIAIFPFWERTVENEKLLEFIGCRGVDYLMPIIEDKHKPDVYKLFEQYLTENSLNIYIYDIPENHSFYTSFYSISTPNKITIPCGVVNLQILHKYREFEYDKRYLIKHNEALQFSIYLNEKIPIPLLEKHINGYINIVDNKYKYNDTEKFQSFLTLYLNDINDKKIAVYADLHNDTETIYSVIGIKCRETIYLLNFVFNLKYKKFAPGKILLTELIIIASKRGYKKIDFSRGTDIYKSKLGCDFINNMSLLITSSNKIRQFVAKQNQSIGFFPSSQ
ncbi:MAG: GNAT family N-acetyltransferase [Bacteroidales bacterium]|jgi:hypothetical protein|nr:GNAT family N-acetyltransferase [Bacteroidales bacterium]